MPKSDTKVRIINISGHRNLTKKARFLSKPGLFHLNYYNCNTNGVLPFFARGLLAHVEVVTQPDGLNQSDCDNHYKS